MALANLMNVVFLGLRRALFLLKNHRVVCSRCDHLVCSCSYRPSWRHYLVLIKGHELWGSAPEGPLHLLGGVLLV